MPPHKETSTKESCPFSICHSLLSPLDQYESLKGAHVANTQKQNKLLLITVPVNLNSLPAFPGQQQYLLHSL